MHQSAEPIAASEVKHEAAVLASAEQETQRRAPLFNKVLKLIAWPVSVVTGFMVAHTEVRDKAYNMAKRQGVFDALLPTHNNENRANHAQRVADVIDKEAFMAEHIHIKQSYSKQIQSQMEHMGIGSFTKKWNYIHRTDKQNAVISGVMIGAVALGALLTASASRNINELLFGNSKDDEKNR